MIGQVIEAVVAELSRFIIATISALGYAGIVVTMAIESACIPLPSEIIMPFAGYLVLDGRFSIWGVTLAGTIGNVIGSALAYYVGLLGGRPIVERYGRYALIRSQDLEQADRWFAKYGEAAVLISRMLPVIRTFISLPAGIARMPFWRFVVFTFIGALPWCFLLAYIGVVMGEHWADLREHFHYIDVVIGLCLAAAAGYFLWSHWPARGQGADTKPPSC
jgi:membrane protein DedA with SNARE-associated domain